MSADWVSVTSGMLRVRGLPVTMTSIHSSSACTGENGGNPLLSLCSVFSTIVLYSE